VVVCTRSQTDRKKDGAGLHNEEEDDEEEMVIYSMRKSFKDPLKGARGL
jgi:hypothetical protein